MKRTISAIGIVIVFAFLLTACRQMPVVRQQESTTLSAAGAAHPQKLLTVSSGEEATAVVSRFMRKFICRLCYE